MEGTGFTGMVELTCSNCGDAFLMDEDEAMNNKGDYICSTCDANDAVNEPKERFEYRVEPPGIGGSDFIKLLNNRGVEGWELVTISQQGTLVFKRRYVE